jgi:hypothetical protein
MTDNASVKILVNGVALAVAENTYNGAPEFSYSGRLEESLSIGDLSSDFVTWFAIASREGSATLTIDYTTGASEVFIVEPGLPLLVQGRDDDTIVTAIVSVDDAFVDIEIMAYTGVTPLNPAAPAFLILDAGAGVTEDPFLAGSVTAWTDARAVSLAPLPFAWGDDAEEEPTLIASDPDFNGRPSIQFGAGESAFIYSGVASVFDFMDGSLDGDFTLMMICSFPDDAVNNANYQGIWSTSAGTTAQGYRAYIDPAYRLTTYLAETDVDTTQEEEFAPKPSVIIWRVEGQELRVYFQGRWSTSSVEMAGSSPGDNSRLRIGEAMRPGVGALPLAYFRGKIANITLYDSAVDVDEICVPYIASAVADYGVDDTAEQGFPWLSDVVNFHRANRGVNWANEAEDELDAWYDTRPEVAAGASTWSTASGRGTPVLEAADSVMGDQPTWVFEGGSSIDAMTNPYTGTTGDHFGGDGMTVAMVMYLPELEVEGTSYARCILSQGTYDDDYANLAGISIRLNGLSPEPSNVITYELDTGADQDLVSQTGSYLQPLVPYAFVFRCDGTSWWVDELNIATGTVVTSETGAADLTPNPISSSTSATMWMGGWPGLSVPPTTNMAVSEMSSIADRVTNAEVTKFFTYARNRYGSA